MSWKNYNQFKIGLKIRRTELNAKKEIKRVPAIKPKRRLKLGGK
jgi:hypothetical protein